MPWHKPHISSSTMAPSTFIRRVRKFAPTVRSVYTENFPVTNRYARLVLAPIPASPTKTTLIPLSLSIVNQLGKSNRKRKQRFVFIVSISWSCAKSHTLWSIIIHPLKVRNSSMWTSKVACLNSVPESFPVVCDSADDTLAVLAARRIVFAVDILVAVQHCRPLQNLPHHSVKELVHALTRQS